MNTIIFSLLKNWRACHFYVVQSVLAFCFYLSATFLVALCNVARLGLYFSAGLELNYDLPTTKHV